MLLAQCNRCNTAWAFIYQSDEDFDAPCPVCDSGGMADPTPQAVAAVRQLIADNGITAPDKDSDTLATLIAAALTEVELVPPATIEPELEGHEVADGSPPADPTTPA